MHHSPSSNIEEVHLHATLIPKCMESEWTRMCACPLCLPYQWHVRTHRLRPNLAKGARSSKPRPSRPPKQKAESHPNDGARSMLFDQAGLRKPASVHACCCPCVCACACACACTHSVERPNPIQAMGLDRCYSIKPS